MITETKIEITSLFNELISGIFHNITAPAYAIDHIINLASQLGIKVNTGIKFDNGTIMLYI